MKKIAFIKDFHKNEFRRDGITPYFTHLERVAKRVFARSSDSEAIKAKLVDVAYYHDYLESGGDKAKLREIGLEEDVIIAIIKLTKERGRDYILYINEIKGDYLARQVKIADILDNISDNPTDKQILKYSRALPVLLEKA